MKKLLATSLGCVLVAGLVSHALATGIAESTVTLKHNGTLSGSLMLPTNRTAMPVVLLISGSGPVDRDGNAPGSATDCLKQLARQLAAAGIASVRYDKRGIGKSVGASLDESAMRFETYVEDAVAWVRQLRNDCRFQRVIVAGHSEGALIGALAASISGADGVVSIAGLGTPAHVALNEQLRDKLPPALSDENDDILASLRSGRTVACVSAALAAFYRPSVQPYLISWFAYDPAEAVKALAVPLLIVQGDRDIQVPASAAETLSRAANRHAVRIIPGMNHVLKSVASDLPAQRASYDNPRLPIARALSSAVAAFIKAL